MGKIGKGDDEEEKKASETEGENDDKQEEWGGKLRTSLFVNPTPILILDYTRTTKIHFLPRRVSRGN